MAAIIPSPALAELTTLRTGAPPERLVEAATSAEATAILREVWGSGDDWLALGGGSNLFVGDEPFAGTVVRLCSSGIERRAAPHPDRVRLRVQAGHDWDALVAHTVAEGLAGIEAMSGIPGTVGAAPVQNIGAYGQEIRETLVEVELIDERTGEVGVVAASELGLGFRTSVLKHHYGSVPARRAVILSVTVELAVVGPGSRVVHGEQLRRSLGLNTGEAISLESVRERVLATRAAKGMLWDADDPDTHGAGSFFQNPIVSEAVARTLPADCPRWPVAAVRESVTVIPLGSFDGSVPALVNTTGDVKVSAAWLIEQAGIAKGFRLPRSRAAVSSKHALALTNRGGASAEELAQLARFIQSRVHAEFGLVLQPEPVLVGVEL